MAAGNTVTRLHEDQDHRSASHALQLYTENPSVRRFTQLWARSPGLRIRSLWPGAVDQHSSCYLCRLPLASASVNTHTVYHGACLSSWGHFQALPLWRTSLCLLCDWSGPVMRETMRCLFCSDQTLLLLSQAPTSPLSSPCRANLRETESAVTSALCNIYPTSP